MAETAGIGSVYQIDSTESGSLVTVISITNSETSGGRRLHDASSHDDSGETFVPGLQYGSASISSNYDAIAAASGGLVAIANVHLLASASASHSHLNVAAGNNYTGEYWLESYAMASPVSGVSTFDTTWRLNSTITKA